jgi:glucokinase
MAPVLAIDLGCTKYIVAAADDDGVELGRERGATPGAETDAPGDHGVEILATALERVCARAGIDIGDASALAIGSPGPLNRRTGVILSPPQLPWGDYPLAPRLSERLGGVTVSIDNDCKVGGIGEHRFGAGAGAGSMAYFGVGTGIGGCVIVDGRVQYGESDNASEIGHLCVWMHGPPCGCGSDGCLEGIASGSGIAARARARAREDTTWTVLQQAAGGDVDSIDGAMVVAAAAAGDEPAARIWRDATVAMGAGVASMMNALSPEVVVIGGGIAARHGGEWVAQIETEARRRAIGPNADCTRIMAAQLGEDSVLRGAIALALDRARSQA